MDDRELQRTSPTHRRAPRRLRSETTVTRMSVARRTIRCTSEPDVVDMEVARKVEVLIQAVPLLRRKRFEFRRALHGTPTQP